MLFAIESELCRHSACTVAAQLDTDKMDEDNYYDVIPGSNATSPTEKNAPAQYIYIRVTIHHIGMQVGRSVDISSQL